MPSASNATPKVSVIIPSYKTAPLIARCLDAVMAQSFQDFEVIVVNDGSPDAPELERALQPFMDRIVYIKQENRGPSGARNTAIRNARGKYIACLDSDDIYLSDHLSQQVELLERNGLDLTYSDSLIFRNGKPAGRAFEKEPQHPPVTFEKLLKEECCVMTSATVASRQAMIDAGLFDERYRRCEDFDLWLRMSFNGARMDYYRGVGIEHRLQPSGLSADDCLLKQARIEVYKKVLNLPLSSAQHQLVCELIDWTEGNRQMDLVKRYVRARQYAEARDAAERALTLLKDRKSRLAVFGLRTIPRAFGGYLRTRGALSDQYARRGFRGAPNASTKRPSLRLEFGETAVQGSEMIVKLIQGTRKALGLQRPGRNLDVWPDDVFILSFPKSGNTWTRFLIANLAYPETPADFSNINRLTPDPEVLSKRALARMPRPRILKSHQYFHPRYKRVIYVVRDPRDVALSQFHFHLKRKLIGDDYPIEKFVSRFVAGETGPYGSWGDNVASWLSTRHNRPRFLLLRYEDMLDNTARELAKAAAFLEIPPDAERIRNAVARSAADEMRKLEKSQALQWSSTKETRQDVPFVRAARAGGWRTGLPESAVAELEAAWGSLMTYLGYELRFPQRSTTFDSHFVEPILNGPAR